MSRTSSTTSTRHSVPPPKLMGRDDIGASISARRGNPLALNSLSFLVSLRRIYHARLEQQDQFGSRLLVAVARKERQKPWYPAMRVRLSELVQTAEHNHLSIS